MVDEQPLSTTQVLPDRYDRNQSNTMPRKSNCRSRRSNNSSWSTMSKAALRSSRHTADVCPPSVARSKSLNTFVTAVSGLWYRLCADCIFGINPLLSKKAWTRTWTTFSSNLERSGRFDTGLYWEWQTVWCLLHLPPLTPCRCPSTTDRDYGWRRPKHWTTVGPSVSYLSLSTHSFVTSTVNVL